MESKICSLINTVMRQIFLQNFLGMDIVNKKLTEIFVHEKGAWGQMAVISKFISTTGFFIHPDN